jgi:hypothetical protein
VPGRLPAPRENLRIVIQGQQSLKVFLPTAKLLESYTFFHTDAYLLLYFSSFSNSTKSNAFSSISLG